MLVAIASQVSSNQFIDLILLSLYAIAFHSRLNRLLGVQIDKIIQTFRNQQDDLQHPPFLSRVDCNDRRDINMFESRYFCLNQTSTLVENNGVSNIPIDITSEHSSYSM